MRIVQGVACWPLQPQLLVSLVVVLAKLSWRVSTLTGLAGGQTV